MNPDIKARWLAALRSGTYKQGKGSLRYTSQTGEVLYCCLGVLCETEGLNVISILPSFKEALFEYEGVTSAHLLPGDYGGVIGLSPAQVQHLVEMNDNGTSFEGIADYIENEL